MTIRELIARAYDRLRGSLKPEGTMAFPTPTAQHYQETEDQKFRREHGYSKATAPAPWSEDISKHNKEVQAEYAEEVERRKVAFANGEYQPRFGRQVALCPSCGSRLQLPEDEDAIIKGVLPRYCPVHYVIVEESEVAFVFEPDWDLEMSLRPGARLDVTKEVPNLPLLTGDEQAQAREIGRLGRVVAAIETDPITKYVGTREEVLRACDGDDEKADQVFAKARQLFGQADPTGMTG